MAQAEAQRHEIAFAYTWMKKPYTLINDRKTRLTKNCAGSEGYVDIIDVRWKSSTDPKELASICEEFDTDDPYDKGEQPVEGCRMHDVGRMRVHPIALMVGAYNQLDVLFELRYVHPPNMGEYRAGEEFLLTRYGKLSPTVGTKV